MQVLVVLAEAAGKVVTRATLFERCWGGVYVGDDSLNRAIAALRKLGADIAAGSFEIETIPRTGYRLIEHLGASEQANQRRPAGTRRVSRRTVVGGALAVAGAGGLGLWSVRRSQGDRRFRELMDGADQAMRFGSPASASKAIEYLQPAVAMRPDDAKALGLLAYAQSAITEYGDPNEAGVAIRHAEQAARAALALDPNEPLARLARLEMQHSELDLAAEDTQLRQILATAPNNTIVMHNLWDLLQSTGQSHAAWAMNERAFTLDPLAAAHNYPRAQLLWILGRNAEADRVIDRAMGLWPEHPWVRFARFTIYTFTGRPRAALAMLDDEKRRPQFTPAGISAWRVSLAALDQRSPATIAAARAANFELARKIPARASQAVLTLSALGYVDEAFDIANELLLFRRAVEPRPQSGLAPPVKSTGARFTPWLFTPPIAAMRADPRFKLLCDGIGLTDYWAKRGIKPDYQLSVT